MPLFEVAILEVPTKKEMEEGNGLEKLTFGPIHVVAKDTQATWESVKRRNASEK
jgi:hypothetical protein